MCFFDTINRKGTQFRNGKSQTQAGFLMGEDAAAAIN